MPMTRIRVALCIVRRCAGGLNGIMCSLESSYSFLLTAKRVTAARQLFGNEASSANLGISSCI